MDTVGFSSNSSCVRQYGSMFSLHGGVGLGAIVIAELKAWPTLHPPLNVPTMWY